MLFGEQAVFALAYSLFRRFTEGEKLNINHKIN